MSSTECKDEHRSARWQNISGAEEANQLLSYLKQLSKLPTVQKYKESMHSLVAVDKSKPSKVLDVGCGAGSDSVSLRKKVGFLGKVIGVDASEHFVRYANSKYARKEDKESDLGRVGFCKGSIYAPTSLFDENSFDAILVDRVFQHLQDPLKAITELNAILKPGGRLIVSDPDWRSLTLHTAIAEDDKVSEASRKRFREMDELLAHNIGHSITNRDIGSHLPFLFSRVGLQDLKIATNVMLQRSEEDSFSFKDKDTREDLAKKYQKPTTGERWMTPEEFDEWSERRKKSEEQGSFFGMLTIVTTSGIKKMHVESS